MTSHASSSITTIIRHHHRHCRLSLHRPFKNWRSARTKSTCRGTDDDRHHHHLHPSSSPSVIMITIKPMHHHHHHHHPSSASFITSLHSVVAAQRQGFQKRIAACPAAFDALKVSISASCLACWVSSLLESSERCESRPDKLAERSGFFFSKDSFWQACSLLASGPCVGGPARAPEGRRFCSRAAHGGRRC